MAAPENTKMTHLHYIAKGISHPSKALNSGVPVTSMGQIASTNVCESTGRYQEPGTSVKECQLSIKSSREISSLLNIAESAVGDIIPKIWYSGLNAQ